MQEFIKKIESLVSSENGVLTLVVALWSFVLFFSNLRSSGGEAGFDPILARVTGRSVLMPSSSPSPKVLRNSHRGENTWFGWIIFSIFTGVSDLFNVVVSQELWISRVAHVIPRITLMLSV